MKMKRISAAMLATVMALSLAACGAPAESTGAGSEGASDVQISTERTDEQADPAESATAPAVTETTEQTTTATTAPTEPEAPVELPVLNVEPALVMNGCMAFKADGKNYVYNITENEMYETEYDVDDITVLKGCVAVVGNVSYSGFNNTDATVINLKTNEMYANIKPFYNGSWNGDYLTVGSGGNGFSAGTVSVGLLNNKGEWVLPLSDEYSICENKNILQEPCVYQNDKLISFGTSCNYNVMTDAAIEDLYVWDIVDEKIISYEDNTSDGTKQLYIYDINSNEKTPLASNVAINSYGTLHYAKDYTVICDDDYNSLPFDLSDYEILTPTSNIKNATSNVIVFNAYGNDGKLYEIILDENKDYICEPRLITNKDEEYYHVYFSKNKIVFLSNKITDRIIDINTGENTEYDDNFKIVDYDTENNLMLVNTNGAYYLVDPETPDVLINPFERTNG